MDVTEKELNKLLDRLKKNTFYEEYKELGQLLMIHVDDMTFAEKQRMQELQNIIKKEKK